jgi:hypothetical protein
MKKRKKRREDKNIVAKPLEKSEDLCYNNNVCFIARENPHMHDVPREAPSSFLEGAAGARVRII